MTHKEKILLLVVVLLLSLTAINYVEWHTATQEHDEMLKGVEKLLIEQRER